MMTLERALELFLLLQSAGLLWRIYVDLKSFKYQTLITQLQQNVELAHSNWQATETALQSTKTALEAWKSEAAKMQWELQKAKSQLARLTPQH